MVDLEYHTGLYEIKPERWLRKNWLYNRAFGQLGRYDAAAGGGYHRGNSYMLGLEAGKTLRFSVETRRNVYNVTAFFDTRSQDSGLIFYSKQLAYRKPTQIFRMPQADPSIYPAPPPVMCRPLPRGGCI